MELDGKGDVGEGTCPENLFGDAAASCTSSSSSSTEASSVARTSDRPPLLGSASLAVELTRNSERSSQGKNLVVAEWGERRIARVEGETGARDSVRGKVLNFN